MKIILFKLRAKIFNWGSRINCFLLHLIFKANNNNISSSNNLSRGAISMILYLNLLTLLKITLKILLKFNKTSRAFNDQDSPPKLIFN